MPAKPRPERTPPQVDQDTSTNRDTLSAVLDTPPQDGGVPPQAEPLVGAVDAAALVDDHAAHHEGFDAAIHAVGDDGKPKLNKDGTLQKKRGGNMRGATSSTSSTTRTTAKAAKADTTEAAKLACNTVINLAVITLGEEWAPADKGERDGLVGAVKNYFDAKGVVDVSPGWGLIFAALAYSVPRVAMPITQSKLQRVGAAVRSAYAWSRTWLKRA